MKPIAMIVSNGFPFIETETKRWFRKPLFRSFQAISEYPPGYFKWVERSTLETVGDRLSFQLDDWYKLLKERKMA